MKMPALMPTITHRVRAFLRAQGAHVAPWSGLQDTYGELYALLERRRDDPAFWEPLGILLHDIVAAATDPTMGCLTTPDAELLAAWDIDALVRDLQTALGQQAGPLNQAEATRDTEHPSLVDTLDRFMSTLTAPCLGAFLLLGVVVAGCGGQTADEGHPSGSGGTVKVAQLDAGVAGTDGATGGKAGAGGSAVTGTGGSGAGDSGLRIEMPDSSVLADSKSPEIACEPDSGNVIARTIAVSTQLDVYEKGQLCRCLTDLNASWTDGLTALFETESDASIASALEEMVQCCSYYSPGIHLEFDTVRDRFLDGSLCVVARPYKGVSIPER